MGHVDVNTVTFSLPDGRPLLHDVSLRVGEGAKVALIGPNGTGKTTLTRIIAGDLVAHEGAVTRTGGLGTMRQFVGKVRDDSTVRDLLLSVAPQKIRSAAAEVERTELVMVEHESDQSQMDYAQALVDWGDAGGYEYETLWDVCSTSAVGLAFEKAQWRRVTTLSGGEQKRLVLEALLRGPEEVLLLDEPDNYLDVPAKRWLEEQLIASPKTVLFVSHDRELLGRVATRIATLEPGAAGSMLWVTPGGSRPTTRPGSTASRGSRSCASGGTRSTRSSRPSWSCTARRPPTTRTRPPGCRLPRPGFDASSTRVLRRRCRCSRTSRCGCAGVGRRSVP